MVVQSLPNIIPKFWHKIRNPFNLFINHLALGRRERCSCFISAQKSHGTPGLIHSLFASEIGLDFVFCGYCLQSLLWSQKGPLLIEWQRVCPVNGRNSLAFLSSAVKCALGRTSGITGGSDWVTLINVNEVPGGSPLPFRAAGAGWTSGLKQHQQCPQMFRGLVVVWWTGELFSIPPSSPLWRELRFSSLISTIISTGANGMPLVLVMEAFPCPSWLVCYCGHIAMIF